MYAYAFVGKSEDSHGYQPQPLSTLNWPLCFLPNCCLCPLNTNPSIELGDPKMTPKVHSEISLPKKTYSCKRFSSCHFHLKTKMIKSTHRRAVICKMPTDDEEECAPIPVHINTYEWVATCRCVTRGAETSLSEEESNRVLRKMSGIRRDFKFLLAILHIHLSKSLKAYFSDFHLQLICTLASKHSHTGSRNAGVTKQGSHCGMKMIAGWRGWLL